MNSEELQQQRRSLSQLDDFDQDVILGNAVSIGRQNLAVNSGAADREFTVNNIVSNPTTKYNKVNNQTLQRCLNYGVVRQPGKIVETVGDRTQSAILIAIDDIFYSEIELAFTLMNASSGEDVACITANSKRWEDFGITAPPEILFKR